MKGADTDSTCAGQCDGGGVADGWMNATQLVKLSGLKSELEAAFIDREITQHDCQVI
jgi:hypothetical protein